MNCAGMILSIVLVVLRCSGVAGFGCEYSKVHVCIPVQKKPHSYVECSSKNISLVQLNANLKRKKKEEYGGSRSVQILQESMSFVAA